MGIIAGIQGQPAELIDGAKVNSLIPLTAGNGVQLEGRTNGVAIEAGKVGERIVSPASSVILTQSSPVSGTDYNWGSTAELTLTAGIWQYYFTLQVNINTVAVTAGTNNYCYVVAQIVNGDNAAPILAEINCGTSTGAANVYGVGGSMLFTGVVRVSTGTVILTPRAKIMFGGGGVTVGTLSGYASNGFAIRIA